MSKMQHISYFYTRDDILLIQSLMENFIINICSLHQNVQWGVRELSRRTIGKGRFGHQCRRFGRGSRFGELFIY